MGQLCLSDSCLLQLSVSLYVTLSLPQSTSHEEQMGCLSEPSLKNHYHLSSLPDLSLSKPGVHLESKSSQPSIYRPIEPSICMHFFFQIRKSSGKCVAAKNLMMTSSSKCWVHMVLRFIRQVLVCQFLFSFANQIHQHTFLWNAPVYVINLLLTVK